MVWSSKPRSHHGFSILCSTIKIDVDGSCASKAQYNFGHPVNMQLIKIPTTSYVNATLKEMGAWFPKDKGGGYLTFGTNGENPNVHKRTHQIVNHLFLSYSTNHLTLQGVVGQLFPWGKGSMGSRQSWKGCQNMTPCFPKGVLSPNYPHVEEGRGILHT